MAAEKAAAKSDKVVESEKLAAQTLFESEAEREFKMAAAGALSNRNDLKAFFYEPAGILDRDGDQRQRVDAA